MPQESAPRTPVVLLVDDEAYVLESLRRLLAAEGFQVVTARNVAEASAALDASSIDITITDLSLGSESGLSVLRKAHEVSASLPVIVFTGYGTVQTAVAAMKEGAIDFLTKPVEPDALIALVRRAVAHVELVDEVRSLRANLGDGSPEHQIIGESAPMKAMMKVISSVAPTEARVLILGESGTGKELVAHAIHAGSSRARKPMVRVNCAAIPDLLFESEFFGHKRGSFTGAQSDREGRFAEAHGGTLVLDEIGTLKSDAQAKLLRAIESGEYQPVGVSRTRRADTRILSIANENLEERVRAGTFREDLFYRIAVVPIVVPSLRSRKDDIPPLAEYFFSLLARRDAARQKHLTPAAVDVLMQYDWPGNVRELRNSLERASLLIPTDEIGADAMARIIESGMFTIDEPGRPRVESSADLRLRERTNALERELILEALRRCGGVRKDAAELLGIDASNFAYYTKKHKLTGPG